MEESLQATRLELWCEAWWRDHGWKVKILHRELAFTEYEISSARGRLHYQVPLVPVQGSRQFEEDFLSYWTGRDLHES